MGDADGRLELDELGDVIDHASRLGSPRPPVRAELLEGVGSATWGERLEAAGVTPCVRRHRVVLALTTAVVVLGGAGATTWVRARPPSVDLTIAADVETATFGYNALTVGDTNQQLLAQTFTVTPRTPGDVITVIGLTGAGIGSSSIHPEESGPPAPSTSVDVVAILGCDDPAAIAASPGALNLQVTRTDAYGRATAGTLPLPAADTALWLQSIASTCGTERLYSGVTTGTVTVAADDAHGGVVLTIPVHNALDRGVVVTDYLTTAGVFVWPTTITVPAGASGEIPVAVTLTDCAAPSLTRPYVAYGAQPHERAPADGLQLSTQLDPPGDSTQQGVYSTTLATWPAATQREIQSGFDRICAGHPAASARVLRASTAPAAVVAAAVARTADPSTTVLRLSVEVTTSGSHVQVSSGESLYDLASGVVPWLTSATKAVVSGKAVVSIDWTIQCGNGAAGPPEVQLTLTRNGRSYPARAVLGDDRIARAYLTECPAVLPADAAGAGWTVLGTAGQPDPTTPLLTS